PELGDGAGPQALHEDVGARHQAAQDLEAALALEIQREAALVAIERHERGALLAPERRRPGARVVAAAGPLDLDDLRAHVAEDLRAERPGDVLGEIDDDEPVEWERHGGGVYHRRSATAVLTGPPMKGKALGRWQGPAWRLIGPCCHAWLGR